MKYTFARCRGKAGRAAPESSRGFTLIELLVVIAIIGLLSSIVLASLNSARAKSRDARRIADLKQLQTALELYYDANSSSYPPATTQTTSANFASTLSGLVSGGYISTIPNDPSGGTKTYVYKTTAGGTFYCLGADVEGTPPTSSCNTGTSGLNGSLTGVDYSVGP